MQNSDFEIRLQTLAAMGGDTSKTYDSVYSIDLEILRLTEQGGGGGGMTYDQIKAALAASGVTEIVFNDGDSSVTLDYDLISQIGQGGGGGEYICVNTVDELSGVTDPKDGMIAYVGEHIVVEEKKVVVFDAYNDGSYVRFDYGDSNDCHFHTWDNGWSFSLEGTGGFQGGGDYKSYDNRDQFPIDFTFNNGATGTLVAIEHGDEWDSHQEYKVTVWLDKYNNAYPTITFETGEYTTVVESGATTENVNVPIKAKGMFKYYADEAKWFAYEVWLDNLNATELDDILQDYFDYRKPLSGWFKKDDSGWSYRKGFAGGTYETSEPQIHFTTPVDYTNGGYWKAYSKQYYRNDSNHWGIYNDIYDKSFVSDSEVRESMAQKIYTISQPNGGIDIGGLYNVGVNETVSGVTISTTLPIDATATTSQHIASIYNRNSGRGNWEQLSEDGWLFTNKGGISASTSPEWYVIDYAATWDGSLNKMVTMVLAAKIEDNGDDTFTVTYFLGGNNWEEEGYDDRGKTDYYEWQPDTGRGYTWTVTQNQTLTVTPHLYTQVRFDHGDDTNARYIHKFI